MDTKDFEGDFDLVEDLDEVREMLESGSVIMSTDMGDWYVIPNTKREEWVDLLDMYQGRSEEFEPPEWASAVLYPSQVVFGEHLIVEI